MIHIAAPIVDNEEISAVNSVLKSGVLAQGPKVAEFENDFAYYCGTKDAIAVSSGTAALHASLYAAGIREGDEVVTTPFSFIATINPILMQGARPTLVDIDPDTFCIDTNKIEAAITKKTKAIIPVHLYGQTCDYDKIKTIAKTYDLRVIEDACQAVGTEYKGTKAGSLGDLGCFSLYATKNIMSGEGGVITTNNEEYAALLRQFRQHGMSSQYDYVDIGYNYRMTDLQAAIAIAQLDKVDKFNDARRKNAEALSKGLADIPGLIIPKAQLGSTHVWHQYTVRITKDFSMDRQALHERLKERGIVTGIYYPKPLHAFKHIQRHGYKIGDFPNAERAAAEVLSLPVHPKLTKDNLAFIISTIKEVTRDR